MVAPFVAAILPDAVGAIGRLLDRIIPDPEAKAKALLELKKEDNAQALQELTLELQAMQAQTNINLEEAKSSSLFVAGARPFIMWVCGFGLAYHTILQPLLTFIIVSTGHTIALPVFDTELLNTTLFGMLGIGAMRSFDKMKGVDTKKIG